MKTIFILLCLEFFEVVMSSPVHSTGSSQHLSNPGLLKQAFASKKPSRRPQSNKHPILLNTQGELDSYIENLSPEYKYEDDNDKKDTTAAISSNPKLGQDFPLEDSQRRVHQKSFSYGIGHAGPSLEQINMMLQNSLPEYKYDKALRGYKYNSCADLDPDCRKYEMDGLCSDNPNFILKRFNCKKTCNLCHVGNFGGSKKKHHGLKNY